MKQYIYRMRKREASKFIRSLGALESSEVRVYGSHDAIEIKLTDEALQAIASKAEEVYEACGRKWSTIDDLKVGIQGQAASADYLLGKWKKCFDGMRYDEPDIYDILYNGFGVDVKTHNIIGYTHDPYTWMVVNLGSFRTRHYPYYIACQKLSEEIIRILGFISCEKLSHVGVPANYSYPHEPDSDLIAVKSINDLTPINWFKETLDREILRFRQTEA